MVHVSPKVALLLATAFASLGLAPLGTGDPAPGADCQLEYQRADNMWAAEGRPDGNLGVETITLSAGGYQSLKTDWKYEKMRNDGRNYYGSHLRIATNRGTRQLTLYVTGGVLTDSKLSLQPGQQQTFKHDLWQVGCN